MPISDGEKLIIHMLADIQEASGFNGQFDPAFIRNNVSGNFWAIKTQYPSIFQVEDDDKRKQVEWVHNMLTMWRMIEAAYENLGPADQERVKAAKGSYGKAPHLDGFDGNAGYSGIANTMIDQLELYDEFKGRAMDAHTRNEDVHDRMWVEYRKRSAGNYSGLTADDLIAIVDARIHPSQRT